MEGKKDVGSSSSLSSDLSGAKNTSSSSSSSSSSTRSFGAVLAPASTGLGIEPSRFDVLRSLTKEDTGNDFWTIKKPIPDNNIQSSEGQSSNVPSKDRSSIFQDERAEPWSLNSSLFYGGQDFYSHSQNTQTSPSKPYFKKDEGENEDSAARGNWWQGSLYY